MSSSWKWTWGTLLRSSRQTKCFCLREPLSWWIQPFCPSRPSAQPRTEFPGWKVRLWQLPRERCQHQMAERFDPGLVILKVADRTPWLMWPSQISTASSWAEGLSGISLFQAAGGFQIPILLSAVGLENSFLHRTRAFFSLNKSLFSSFSTVF